MAKFGKRGNDADIKEMKQLHHWTCFGPMDLSELIESEKSKIVDAIMLLQEKRDKSIKGRCVYNGKPTRDWLTREDTSSPTASLESVMIMATIDAHEEQDVMTADVPNAFIQRGVQNLKKVKIILLWKLQEC